MSTALAGVAPLEVLGSDEEGYGVTGWGVIGYLKGQVTTLQNMHALQTSTDRGPSDALWTLK